MALLRFSISRGDMDSNFTNYQTAKTDLDTVAGGLGYLFGEKAKMDITYINAKTDKSDPNFTSSSTHIKTLEFFYTYYY